MSRWILIPAVFLGSSACAGAPRQRADSAHLRTTIQELESSARKERNKVRSLEHEVARLESKLGHSRPATHRSHDATLSGLPVEVVEPEKPDVEDPDESFEVVGVDEDGVEIVYVGEALQDRSVQPDRAYLRANPRVRASARSVPATSRRTRLSSRSPRATRAADADWEQPGERIPLTEDTGPTVAMQLAQVRPPASPSPRGKAPRKAHVPAAAGTPAPPEADGPRSQYDRYYQALRAGNHAFAAAGFRNFIERYPDNDLADNAQYWLGESYYDQRDYQTALEEFRRVAGEHPRGNKVPDALLKIAFCHAALGDAEKARAVLVGLIETHPRSRPASLAAQKLETLARK